ncbi:unnamed protein product [Cuscuta europaea]|uniref:Uncharacterized protein n=1 Tax=Cuscuta europaea TaxID=41803 RepID=A0A9P0Z5S6_CUSEU|nr:unnamed protein product [Cuscuta europaea]
MNQAIPQPQTTTQITIGDQGKENQPAGVTKDKWVAKQTLQITNGESGKGIMKDSFPSTSKPRDLDIHQPSASILKDDSGPVLMDIQDNKDTEEVYYDPKPEPGTHNDNLLDNENNSVDNALSGISLTNNRKVGSSVDDSQLQVLHQELEFDPEIAGKDYSSDGGNPKQREDIQSWKEALPDIIKRVNFVVKQKEKQEANMEANISNPSDEEARFMVVTRKGLLGSS